MGSRREAVIIGAGKMGRGFCAEILASAGCHLTFVDSDEKRVERLRNSGGYTIYKARRTYFETVSIESFDALPLSAEGELSRFDRAPGRAGDAGGAVPAAGKRRVAAERVHRAQSDGNAGRAAGHTALHQPDGSQAALTKFFENMLGGTALEYMHTHVGIVETVAICMCPELPDSLAERDPAGRADQRLS